MLIARFASAIAAAVVIAAPCLAQQHAPFPDHYYYQGAPRGLEGKPLPELKVTGWTTDPVTKADMKGKVVLIDFWGSWCNPCRAALPENVKLWKEHKGDGFVMIGIHDSNRGVDKMEQTMRAARVEYPNAIDDGGATVRAVGLRFWPTYVAVDHKGIVRAVGLSPAFVPEVVQTLLDERKADLGSGGGQEADGGEPAGPAEVQADWLEGRPGGRGPLASLEGAPPPPLQVENWTNGDAVELDDLRGKVVMLDFWSPSITPSVLAIPQTNHFVKKYRDKGLVVIGVCTSDGARQMAEVVVKRGVAYTVCADQGGKTVEAYKVDASPDYYFIDRAGRLRIADARNDKLEEIIEALLAEPAPEDESSAAAN